MPQEIKVNINIDGIWNPVKEGEKLRGFYHESFTFPGDKFDTPVYVISNDFDRSVAVNAYSVIERAFDRIPVGAFVSITYLGTKNTSQNNTYKDFSITAFKLEESEIKEWRNKVNLDVNLKERDNSVDSTQKPASQPDSPADDADDDLPF